MAGQLVDAQRYENGKIRECRDSLTIERPLQIRINGKPYSVTMRSPGDDLALVKGLLYTEGVATITDDDECRYTEERDIERGDVLAVNVEIPEVYLCNDVYEKRSLLASSSCGMCGQREFDHHDLDHPPLAPGDPLALARVHGMIETMRAGQHAFDETGSTHAAAVFDRCYEMLCLFEDIGRHNAVDKAVGHLLEHGTLDRAAILAVSGRVSFEIVLKAYRAGIAYLLAVSAPSSFAVEMGQRWGLSILGYCREGRCTVYSRPERVDV
jgi:FdhD protein